MTTFTSNGEILQTYTVDDSGFYDITANGAQGGDEIISTGVGGEGAKVTAEVYLTQGTTLDILVGAEGSNAFGIPGNGGGGGGGTFVAEEAPGGGDTALVIAGGGGGSGDDGVNGASGLAIGESSPSAISGSEDDGGGGGGFSVSGANGGGSGGYGGSSFDDNGAGGNGEGLFGGQGEGGYGGGGGAGYGGGGGGGYVGGAGGDGDTGSGGGGGSSYLAPSAIELSSESGVATSDGNGYVTITEVVCFASGTRISTARGDVAVEDLRVGELVVTGGGVRRPIKWLGHRTVDCQEHSNPGEARPVRIAAHAFAQDKPSRDLFVSPGHAICVDVLGETLIPASKLINGSTIAQVEAGTITYWHVELDAHDILLAEGLPTESYADCDNRDFFVENDAAAIEGKVDGRPRTTEHYCRPFYDEGPLVAVVRDRLAERAAKLGWTLAPSVGFGDVHLLVDGQRVDPVTRGSQVRFGVPAGASDVWLISSAARPRAIGQNEDSRLLGVRVVALTIDDGFERRAIARDDARLSKGFHDAEADWRWTNGRASLPAALWEGGDDGFFLTVELSGEALPQWLAPSREEATTRGGLRLVGAA